MTMEEVRNRIVAAFRAFTTAEHPSQYAALLSSSAGAGKLYEAFILAKVAEKLVTQEGMSLTLVNSNNIALKSAPGRINRSYPRIDATRQGQTVAELWTDVEFLSLSYWADRTSRPPARGDYHELDILMVQPGLSDRPRHDQIQLGVECKSSGYGKKLLKEILGIRRELSLLAHPPKLRRSPRGPVQPCPQTRHHAYWCSPLTPPLHSILAPARLSESTSFTNRCKPRRSPVWGQPVRRPLSRVVGDGVAAPARTTVRSQGPRRVDVSPTVGVAEGAGAEL